MTSTAIPTEREELPPSDTAAIGTREQMRWFGTFWLLSMAFHHTDSHPWEVLPTLALGLPLLLLPTNVPAFALFVIGSGVLAARNLPGIANHMVVTLFVGLGFAAAGLWVLLRGRRSGSGGSLGESFGQRWFEAARTPVGLTLLVVYFFTVFHKLNTAFFDVVNTCAAHMLNQGLDLNGIEPMPLPPAAVQAAAVGTVVVETVILVFLAVPRLRRWGMLIGVGFHCVLAPASFYDFATTVFALYLLLVPTRAFAAIAPRSVNLRYVALGFFGFHMLVSLTADWMGTSVTKFGLPWHTVLVVSWYLTVLPFMFVLLRAVFADKGPWPGWRLRPVVLLIVPLVVFANGAAPYLGLKTVASYSMFSNLHTEEGRTNHLIPAVNSFQIASFQDEVVTVRNIQAPPGVSIRSPKWMREDAPQVVPWQELRRLVHLWRDAGSEGVLVEYDRGGVQYVVRDAITDPVLAAPMPWWQTKFMSFRAVDSAEGPDICRW